MIFTTLCCIKVTLICRIQNQVIRKQTFEHINRWLNYFFPFLRYITCFREFQSWGWVCCTDFRLFRLSSKLVLHVEFSKHLGKWYIEHHHIIRCIIVYISLSVYFFNWRHHSQTSVFIRKSIASFSEKLKNKKEKVASGKQLKLASASWTKFSLLFLYKQLHQHLLTPKYRLLPYIPQ